MKKDLAEIKAYTEAMADSNHVRDTYVDKEQDKFFHRLNRQWVDIDALKEWVEWCYIQIPKKSGRCQERKVGGSETRPADSY